MKLDPFIRGVKQLEDRAGTGELAYLCLNGKSENHLRDITCFNIARNKPNWSVQREVNHVDLLLANTHGAELKVEFKVGYDAVVISKKEESTVLKEAQSDLRKRGEEIINCIGIMSFDANKEIDLTPYRNPGLIKRSINRRFSISQVKSVVRGVWPHSRCRFTSVNCGAWSDIDVSILFCTVKHV
jgi:hypothetical protein